ncbi:glycine cleavage system T protein [Tuber magnatum]|uniref:Aminomethyltransferase n=1 Tax=Tuber magnatum TaxID=42249 RepID=A0A317SRH9_9PEZI|nr:glycine cleavage system T protein [Tuber magnatum]
MLLPHTTRLASTLRVAVNSKFSVFSRFYSDAAPGTLAKTPLYDLHVAKGAKMAPFAGYSMPVLYSGESVGESHNWVREKAGLFDVSHMVQHRLTGPGALPFLHSVTPSDLTCLPQFRSTLSVFLHPVTGGIVDDLIITSHGPDSFYLVTNAACKEKDLAYIATNMKPFSSDVKHEVLTGQGLVALQGPLAKDILTEYLTGLTGTPADLSKLYFGASMFVEIPSLGERLHVARAGYTGEDGFEISVSERNTETVTTGLLDVGSAGGRIRLSGLGARDSLRLEAGMCLYGHDLDDTTTPIEAGLKWLVGKTRVMDGNFLGAETIGRQYNSWSFVPRRRVGFFVEGLSAREGAEIVEKGTDSVIGKITSGCPSPTLGKNIAMGYIRSGFHKQGTEVGIRMRGRERSGTVTKMPFIETKYNKAP